MRHSRSPKAWRRPSSSAASSSAGALRPRSRRQPLLRHRLYPDAAAAMAQATGCTVFAYLVTDPGALRRRRVRRDRQARRHRGETQRAEIPLGRDRTLFLRQPRARHRRQPQAFARGELEITDVNLAYLALGRAQLRARGTRLCLARHRHAGLSSMPPNLCALSSSAKAG